MSTRSNRLTGKRRLRYSSPGLRSLPLAALTSLLLLAPHPVLAAGNNNEPSLSQWTATRLNKVNELLAEDKYTEARERLHDLLDSLSGDAYEAAMTQQALAYSYALQDNYPKAIEHFEAALKGLEKSRSQLQKTRFDLGQLYMAEQEYDKAIPILKEWIKQVENEPTSLAHILLGNAYYQKEQPKNAIPHVKTAIEQDKEPKEGWYRLLLSLYLDTDQMMPARDLLTVMINRFPDTDIYWKQLGNIHLQLKAFKPGTAAMEIAWQRGLLEKESELLNLANLLLHIEHPEKAGRLLEKEIAAKRIEGNLKNWRLLGTAWLQAREQQAAIEAFDQAARLSDDGNLYLQVAQLHIDRNEWQPARNALEKALSRGGLKQPGNGYLLLGIAQMELDNTEKAAEAFEQAAAFKETKKSANQWLSFMSR